jgi:hypothetical protein
MSFNGGVGGVSFNGGVGGGGLGGTARLYMVVVSGFGLTFRLDGRDLNFSLSMLASTKLTIPRALVS